MSIRYLKITLIDGTRFILRVTRESPHFIVGIEVDAEGDEIVPRGVDPKGRPWHQREHKVQRETIKKAVEMRMNPTYATLEYMPKLTHSIRKTARQLDAEIAEALSRENTRNVTAAEVAEHIDSTNPYRGTSRDAWGGIGRDFNDLVWSKGQLRLAELPEVTPASKRDVKRYGTAAKKGSKIPAIVVRQLNGGYSILDGAHRIGAARTIGLKTLDAFIGRRSR